MSPTPDTRPATGPRPRLTLRRYPAEGGLHSHPGWHQFVLARHGALEMEVDGHGGVVDAGRLALVGAGRRHAFRPRGAGRFLVIDWPTGGPAAESALARCLRSPFLPLGAEQTALGDFLAARVLRGDADSALVAGGTTLLLESLARAGEGVALPPPLRRAMAFLRDNLANPVTATDAARAAGLSTSRLHALFRQWLDDTPRGYLAGLRLDRARALLASGAARHGDLERLATAVGYADPSTLTRAFRARFGVSPGAFRRAATGGTE